MRIDLTQENLEYLINLDNRIRITQECIEIINKSPNVIRVTQECVEVILSVFPENYTDSAANCNFVY